MALVYLSLGTNLGDKELNLKNAIARLSEQVGEVLKQSSFYASESWGFKSENEFLNAVILCTTTLSPVELLKKTQEIETGLGRKNKSSAGYTDRLIDIDILFYDNLIVDEVELKIPHPFIAERDFVLIPLSEVAPELVHPLLGKSISELIKR